MSKKISIDVSEKPFFSMKDKKIQWKYIKPDNMYSLAREYGSEKVQEIYSNKLINKTKYHRILLKEWFYALEKNGYMHIRFKPTNKFTLSFLEKEIEKVLKDSVDIVATKKERDLIQIKVQKTKVNPCKDDEINEWTFGIITDGKKVEAVEKIIKSINEQNIPKYEIIICGKWDKPVNKLARYIYFKDYNKGKITEMKNVIGENAEYENLLIIHDRIELDENWFEGMKKYGNNFEILSCVNMFEGKRGYDWLTSRYLYEDERARWNIGGYLDYTDWDLAVYVDGGAIIMKRYIWEEAPWDPNVKWKEAEDLKLSYDQITKGFLIRFNPWAKTNSLSFRHPLSKLRIKKNDQRLGRYAGPIHYVIGRYLTIIFAYMIGSIHRAKGKRYIADEGK